MLRQRHFKEIRRVFPDFLVSANATVFGDMHHFFHGSLVLVHTEHQVGDPFDEMHTGPGLSIGMLRCCSWLSWRHLFCLPEHCQPNGELSRMEALIEVESIARDGPSGHQSDTRSAPHSSQTQSAAGQAQVPRAAPVPSTSTVTSFSRIKPREVFIQGITSQGRAFRPSDWAERLAGAMSSFRPGGVAMGAAAHLGYSPYCVPTTMGDVKCVVVSEALKDVEPMAWNFVMNFAKDNDLQVVDGCLLP